MVADETTAAVIYSNVLLLSMFYNCVLIPTFLHEREALKSLLLSTPGDSEAAGCLEQAFSPSV